MLRFNVLSGMGRRGVLVVAAICAVMAAACSDDPTAPQVQEPLASVQAASRGEPKSRGVIATLKISDVFGNLITEEPIALFQWFTDQGGFLGALSVTDNSAKDMDPTFGIIKVALAAGGDRYMGCAYWWTDNYKAFNDVSNPWPTCRTVPPGNNKAAIGTVYMRKLPVFRFRMEDMFGGGGYTGGVVDVGSGGGPMDAIEDGEFGWDLDGASDGFISLRSGLADTISWCEIIPPTGFNLTNPTCDSFYADWESDITIVLKHERAAVIAPGL